MSLLLRPVLPASRAAQLTMCLGLAAVEGIEDVTGLRAALKWPNDLVWGGRKLAGMLTDASPAVLVRDFKSDETYIITRWDVIRALS